MDWFKRKDKKIKEKDKKSIPDGLWDKCKSCNEIIYCPELEKIYLYVIIVIIILELNQVFIKIYFWIKVQSKNTLEI